MTHHNYRCSPLALQLLVGAAAASFLLVGCASDEGVDSWKGGSRSSRIDALEAAGSVGAASLLSSLRARFAHELPPISRLDLSRPRNVPQLTNPLPSGLDTLLARAVARAPGELKAKVADAEPAAGNNALIATGSQDPTAFALSDPTSGMTISGRLDETAPTLAERADGYLVWRNTLGADAHVLRRIDANGFEDYVSLETAPTSASLTYAVELDRGVSGMRLVEGTLEFLDASGTPRLRMGHTVIVSSDGHAVAAQLSVSGCAVDTSPLGPWGRKVTPPGRTQCKLHITWDDTKVAYPALVDPAWTLTSDLSTGREGHTATLLASGKVLVAGGTDFGAGVTHASAELFDPATKTWATTGSMMQARGDHTAHRLPDGRVLAVAGSYSATSETYDVTTGTWSLRGNIGEPRSYQAGTTLSDGRVLVTGGLNAGSQAIGTAYLFNPQTNAWSSAGSMTTGRAFMPAITLPNGRVLVPGGTADATTSTCSKTAETFDPATSTWTRTADMSTAHCGHVGGTLPDVAIVAGGADIQGNAIGEVELYSTNLGRWRTSADRLPVAAMQARPAWLPDGSLIVTGGTTGTGVLSTTSSYRFRSNSGYWVTGPTLGISRTFHTSTMLDAQSILVTGGYGADGATHRSAEVVSLEPEERSDKADLGSGLRMSWALPTMIRPMSSTPVSILFNNPNPVGVTGALRIVAWAPDGRRVERTVRTIEIPPCRLSTGGPCAPSSASAEPAPEVGAAASEAGAAAAALPGDFTVDLAPPEIPVQPVNQEGLFRVEFSPINSSSKLETDNVFYKFSSNYTSVALFGENGQDATLAERTYATQDEYLQELNTLLDQIEQPIQGRISLTPGSWQSLTQPIPPEKEYITLVRAQLGRRDPFSKPEFGPREDLWDWLYPPKAPYVDLRDNPNRKICVEFEQNFADGGRGETYGNSTPVPASFFKVALFDNNPLHRSVFGFRLPIDDNLPLDADGCTPTLNLPSGNLFIVVRGEASVPVPGTNSAATFRVRRAKNGVDAGATWALSFANLKGPFPKITLTLPRGKAANTAATLARIARMPDNGVTPGTSVATVFDRANDCLIGSTPVGAMATGRDLRLCPDAPDAAGRPSPIHNANYKFVVAHEFGHTVASGSIPGAGYPGHSGLPLLCSCAHVVGRANALHCLQSMEPLPSGASEGFAQFYATRVWNDFGAVAPIFQYYKQFRESNNTVLPAFEKIVNVRQSPIRWGDNYCPLAGRATEYDFMGFFYSINTAAANERTTLTELFRMMNARRPEQRGRSWNDYEAAAQAQFGEGSAKFIRFRMDGAAFGVDN